MMPVILLDPKRSRKSHFCIACYDFQRLSSYSVLTCGKIRWDATLNRTKTPLFFSFFFYLNSFRPGQCWHPRFFFFNCVCFHSPRLLAHGGQQISVYFREGCRLSRGPSSSAHFLRLFKSRLH